MRGYYETLDWEVEGLLTHMRMDSAVMRRVNEDDLTPRSVSDPEPWNGIYTCPNGLHLFLPQGDRRNGIHGYNHWETVVQNGLTIARCNGADQLVVSLFGWLHDARRENDGSDPRHGERAVKLAIQLQGRVFELNADQFGQLLYALEIHDKGHTDPDITIGTCWDADRLDLPRVGIIPDPLLMSTTAGKALAQEVQYRYS